MLNLLGGPRLASIPKSEGGDCVFFEISRDPIVRRTDLHCLGVQSGRKQNMQASQGSATSLTLQRHHHGGAEESNKDRRNF